MACVRGRQPGPLMLFSWPSFPGSFQRQFCEVTKAAFCGSAPAAYARNMALPLLSKAAMSGSAAAPSTASLARTAVAQG